MLTKYNRIGANYNKTRKADPFLVDLLIDHLQPGKDKTYLEIGCGTGNYTKELYNKGVQIIGIDPSELMLSEASRQNRNMVWRSGTAENTGLEDESVDGILCILTVHHWGDLLQAFNEIDRIVRSRGRIVIFTSTPEQMKGYWLNHYFPHMMRDSMQQMPSLSSVRNAMNTSGIEIIETEKYFIRPNLQDHFLYCGKSNPQLYLDPLIRSGISSFSSLANKKEIDEGLAQLQRDINSNMIISVINAYENDKGDYLFVIAAKR